MSWHEENFLTKQQTQQIPIRILPAQSKETILKQSKKSLKHQKLIKMPIPLFEIDQRDESDYESYEEFKHSLGVQRQNSFLISSQLSTLPFQMRNILSVSTQTDDFTFVNNLFAQPKIYEIPVQIELQKSVEFSQKEVQAVEQLQPQTQQNKLHKYPAVLRQNQISIESGVISMSISNYSFSRMDLFTQNQQGQMSGNKDLEQNQQSDNNSDEDELLLEDQPDIDNKQNLFQTAHFEFHTHNYQSSTHTPQKSRLSATQSSPDTNGAMRVSQRDVNMMQTKIIATPKIDEEEYEHLHDRFYQLEQQITQKNDHLQFQSKRIAQLEKELLIFQSINEQKSKFERKCKELQKQLLNKSQQLQKVTQDLVQFQKQMSKFHQNNEIKAQEIEHILITKQKQIQQLQNHINMYRQQVNFEQQNFVKEKQALQSLLSEKDMEINELKSEYQRKYDLYITSIKQMKAKIEHHQLKMQQLDAIINKKDIKIKQTKDEYHKMKQDNSQLCRQFQSMKQQLNRPSSLQSSLNNTQPVAPSIVIKENHQSQSLRSQQKLNKINLNKSKFETTRSNAQRIESKYQNTIVEEENGSEQQRNKHQNDEQQIQSSENEQMNQQRGTIFISESNQASKFATYSFQGHPPQLRSIGQIQYTDELQKIILIYESIIANQLQTIEQLEEKVLEFLKDALTKQNQVELLYSQLCQYQNTMNGLLVEKLDVELDNQRLRKMISDSENKLAILGSRLIKLAKTNLTISYVDRANPSSSSSLQSK